MSVFPESSPAILLPLNGVNVPYLLGFLHLLDGFKKLALTVDLKALLYYLWRSFKVSMWRLWSTKTSASQFGMWEAKIR
jgi:hypothetical protein